MISSRRRLELVDLLIWCSMVQGIMNLLFCTTSARLLHHHQECLRLTLIELGTLETPEPVDFINKGRFSPSQLHFLRKDALQEKEGELMQALLTLTERLKSSEQEHIRRSLLSKAERKTDQRFREPPTQQMVTRVFKSYAAHEHDHHKPSENEDYTFHVDYAGPKRHPPHSH